MPPISITHCLCRRVAFERLLPVARERGWTLEDIRRETGCGDSCGLCRPYLRRMLATGETSFSELLTE
jgi:bacterioferritin-associated ferredoxin